MTQAKENAAKWIFAAAATASVIAVALICVFLFAGGIPGIMKIGVWEFLSGTRWRPGNDIYGILPMILGSLYVTAGALLIGAPAGLLTAVYLSRFASPRMTRILRPAVSLLAGIPSVVYGFWGVTTIVPLIRRYFGGSGSSLLAAALLLGIMILPTIIAVSEAALNAVPQSYYEGALALGATHERAVFSVVLRAARSGVIAAMILGVGRAVGEAMAVMMVAGNRAVIPTSLFRGVRTLTSNIVMEMGYAADLHREALIATGVVLFAFILTVNLTFSLLRRRSQA
ncbi:phosphate ABC transporter permease subunit PstC [Pyramidobacter sp. YE332]|uniref:phosphate ABC transporter permease subunit PstC n=1 Tax=unclassified Pyramidobacter TaxID=2632171 RepID=UPI00098FB1A8|nr:MULTISPECIES: phosphate ABC transporter permease subunit PstC [unclassified Pyramidobacter]OON89956.1 phosphate ABC transporter permease subunit PstC [Pyramidobacter sp. C12-8]WOL39161.1 phosphate ABC transporter permease subunit PstC [Pyramidobacter sp. YE332]